MCAGGVGCSAASPPPTPHMPKNQHLPCDQGVVLGQCFQAKKCRETRVWFLCTAMSSAVPKKNSGILCQGMYALSSLTVNMNK